MGSLQVYGDSKISVDWLNSKSSLQNVGLQAVMEQITTMRRSFHLVSFSHIFREHNSKADTLSKAGVSLEAGKIKIQEENESVTTATPPFRFL